MTPSRPIAVATTTAHPAEEVLSIQPSRVRRSDATIAAYQEDSWPLAALGSRSNQRDKTLNFGSVPERFRDNVKRLLWLLINEGTPADFMRREGSNASRWLSQASLQSVLYHLTSFYRFLDGLDVLVAADVTGGQFDDYFRFVMELRHTSGKHNGNSYSGKHKEDRLKAVERAYYCGPRLPVDYRLARPTWMDEDFTISRETDTSGNTTDELTPDVYGPLLYWACLFIEEFSQDILAARDMALSVRSVTRPSASEPPKFGSGTRRAKDILNAWLATHNSFPSWHRTEPHPEFAAAFLLAWGGGGSTAARLGQVRRDHFAAVPLSGGAPLDLDVQGRVDGRPWIPFMDFYEVDHWVRRLRDACLVVIGLGTGLRPEELLSLTTEVVTREGRLTPAIEEVPLPNGQVRYLVHGRLFKGMRDLRGEQRLDGIPVTWDTNATGALAVSIAMRLVDGDGLLFPSVDDREDTAMLTSRVAVRLTAFAQAVQSIIDRLNLPDAYVIPDAHTVTASRFRRTTLAIIEDQKDGLVAGKVQAKHSLGNVYDTRTTQGYGDTSRRGQLVQERRAALSIAAISELSAALTTKGQGITGPARDEALRVVVSVTPGQPELMRLGNERAFRRLAAASPQKVYKVEQNGATWYCVHDRTKAACSKGEFPDLGDCHVVCPNKAFTDDSLTSIQAHIDALEAEAVLLPKPAADRKRRLADQHRQELNRWSGNAIHLGMPTVRSNDG